ncbi:arabinan endo-1,5-alpha-L-arabinosidase [Candidatus Sumerlaeota bacterium]|nr:arabinan endo-1,5-alpha-L-arabinosidase [Candidatus Sumerlaeota bacterium]
MPEFSSARLNGDMVAHDPSTILRCGDRYWIFHTSRGCRCKFSTDLMHWERGPRTFEEPLDWWKEAVPGFDGIHLWAPDVIHLDQRYLLYYSVSRFGKRTSAIGLAVNATLNPEDPAYGWRDEGPVIITTEDNDYNAIDPALFYEDGRLWMIFGSYWSGIKLVELDPQTGKRLDPPGPVIALAAAPERNNAIEAPYLYQRGEYYYLFVNWDQCCRGVDSTYNIRVGRSRELAGPYVDRDGREMLKNGGTLVIESQGRYIGPGHAAILKDGEQEWFSCHYYDPDATPPGRPALLVMPLSWDDAGWPILATPQ